MTSGVLRDYYFLTKPGIVRANVITAIAGYLFVTGSRLDPIVLIAVVGGTGLMVASGCVFNNIIDRNLDKSMKRTKNRALASGRIGVTKATVLATILALLAGIVLGLATNLLTLFIGVIGFVSYVVFYTFAKRKTMYATEIGTIPGAIAILAGYTAATDTIDTTGLILLLILISWQIPHFYGIALMRYQDYKSGQIPTAAHRKGSSKLKRISLLYILIMLMSCLALFIESDLSIIYGVSSSTVILIWLIIALKNYDQPPETWGKKIFLFSLVTLLANCSFLIVEGFLKSAA